MIDKSEIALRARAIVNVLAGEYPSRNGLNPGVLQKAAAYVEHQCEIIGLKVQSQSYPARGGEVRNLVVEQTGSEPARPCIVVGAHYDTVLGTPGADDNASGVAGLMEMARLLKTYPNRRTIRFVAFPHEEPPYFFSSQMGSRVYAKHLKKNTISVQVMFSLEMIGYGGAELRQTYPFPFLKRLGGYPDHGHFIALVGNIRTHGILKNVRAAMRTVCSIGVEGLTAPGFLPPIFLSDHSSFWKYSFPALMVTDTAFQRNPHYHRAGDTAATLNYDFLAEVVAGMCEAVIALDHM